MFAWKKTILCFVFVLICLIFLQSCKNGVIVSGLDAEGFLTFYNGCKATGAAEASTEILSASDTGKECLEYEYDGSTLLLRHVNAAFNCCLDGIVARIEVDGNVVTITTEEKLVNEQGCFCTCLYDLGYLITNLKPGIYTIVIPSFANLFQIDLSTPTAGSNCEERNGYPWN
jgi:hypothetical protein